MPSGGRVNIGRQMAPLRESDARPYNWGLLLLLALCVEFWVILTTVVTEQL